MRPFLSGFGDLAIHHPVTLIHAPVIGGVYRLSRPKFFDGAIRMRMNRLGAILTAAIEWLTANGYRIPYDLTN